MKLHTLERDFLAQVIDLAHKTGWRAAHFRPAKTEKGWRTAVQADGAGWPDLVLVKPPNIIFAELKVGKGTLTEHQAGWLTVLRGSGSSPYIQVKIWFPEDWEEIKEILSEGRAT